MHNVIMNWVRCAFMRHMFSFDAAWCFKYAASVVWINYCLFLLYFKWVQSYCQLLAEAPFISGVAQCTQGKVLQQTYSHTRSWQLILWEYCGVEQYLTWQLHDFVFTMEQSFLSPMGASFVPVVFLSFHCCPECFGLDLILKSSPCKYLMHISNASAALFHYFFSFGWLPCFLQWCGAVL